MSSKLYDNRLVYYDLMRVIAGFCVVIIHAGIYSQASQWENTDFALMISNFYGILSRWAVPCFVMLSGVMFLNKNKEVPLKKLYLKYILRLCVSYVFWSCVYAMYNSFYEAGGGLAEKLRYFMNYCFSGEIHMWYVLMTIGLYIAMPIIRHIVNTASDTLIKYWLGAMFVFSSLIPFAVNLEIPYISGTIKYINEYVNIQFLCGYTLYFVMGHYLAVKETGNRMKKLIYALGLLGFLYSVAVLLPGRYFFDLTIGALNYFYPNIMFMSLAVFMFFKDKVSKINFSPKARKAICDMSALTYGIFLIHVLVLKVLYHFGINLSICPAAASIIIVSVIAFIISAAIIYPISKIPFVGKYIC